ncbi:TatD related DNase [Spraguea lophii 42_110]|uniref:TatD related DNase n=1 Tax=Spraguea lophii (strain 42_110) TaxID=1358809 RepID=S7WA37_SPRLO|nr:TatD related DNase [Spraguea lophii 42_110]
MFIDIAVNICSFKESERNIIIERSLSHSIYPIFVGVDIQSSLDCINLSSQYKTFCYTGIHPTSGISSLEIPFSENVIAWGECGLDYDRLHFSSKEDQLQMFEKQLQLNNEVYFLHCRNAHHDFLLLVKKYKTKGVVHSFTGTVDEMQELLDNGFYIGVNGCTLKYNSDIVTYLPLDRMLLETDSPYCLIKENRFKSNKKGNNGMLKKGRNEPCRLWDLIDKVKAIKNVGENELEEITNNNFKRIFGRLPWEIK